MEHSSLFKVIFHDISAARKAFEENDFELMNILGNRIMSDALFGDERKLALPGFFLKYMALVYLSAKPRLSTSLFSETKHIGREYIDSLSEFSENSKEAELWESFHKFNNDIRSYAVTDIEREAYEEDPEIAHAALKWLVEYLNAKKEVLINRNNVLFKGILNEAERIFKVYGFRLTDTYFLSLLIALDRYFDYFRIQYRKPTGEVDEQKVKEIIFPYIEKLAQLMSSEREIKPETVGSILWDLIKGWREFFIQYMEFPRGTVEQRIELPEESKKKLSEAIGKALEKEVKL